MKYFELFDAYSDSMLKTKEKDGSVSALTFLNPNDERYNEIIKSMFEICGIAKLTVVDEEKFLEILKKGLEACKQIYGDDFDYREVYAIPRSEKYA